MCSPALVSLIKTTSKSDRSYRSKDKGEVSEEYKASLNSVRDNRLNFSLTHYFQIVYTTKCFLP